MAWCPLVPPARVNERFSDLREEKGSGLVPPGRECGRLGAPMKDGSLKKKKGSGCVPPVKIRKRLGARKKRKKERL